MISQPSKESSLNVRRGHLLGAAIGMAALGILLERVSLICGGCSETVVRMVRQGQISDEFWAIVGPLLPSSAGRRGRPWADHRQMLEGICWRYRAGSPWRDVPEEFGPWKTVWKRHFRWSTDGTYQQMMDAVQDAGLLEEGTQDAVERLLAVDSTVVRAHQRGCQMVCVSGGSDLKEIDYEYDEEEGHDRY